jgi:hypothetical protein
MPLSTPRRGVIEYERQALPASHLQLRERDDRGRRSERWLRSRAVVCSRAEVRRDNASSLDTRDRHGRNASEQPKRSGPMTDRTMLRRLVSRPGSAADTMRSVVVYDYRRNFAVGIVMGAEGVRSR